MKITRAPAPAHAPVVALDTAAVTNAHVEAARDERTDAFVDAPGHASARMALTTTAASAGASFASVAHEGALMTADDGLLSVCLRSARAGTDVVNAIPLKVGAWWRSTGRDHVAGPGASSERAVDVDALARAKTLLAAGDVTSAWRALASSGDGFARLVSSTLGPARSPSTPTTVYSQVVDAHWERITGHGVDGAAYRNAAAALLDSYIAFAGAHGGLPTTEDIERMDRDGLVKLGLPTELATGACQSKLAHELASGFSWGRAMGLPPERVAMGSTVFASDTFDATSSLIKTAHHAVQKYGLTKALTIDGAAATWRGFSSGNSTLSVSPVVLARARELAAQGDIVGAWSELARHGDDYADSAAKIIREHGAPRGAPRDLLAAVVDAHWLRLVGPEKTEAHFAGVAQRHLDNYLALVGNSGGRLPDTRAIERSYRNAVEAEGLPPLVAIDALMSRADIAIPESWLAKLGVTSFSWGAVCGMPKERITYGSDVFADLQFDATAELAATALATLRRHFFSLVRPSNAVYPLNAVRELFS